MRPQPVEEHLTFGSLNDDDVGVWPVAEEERLAPRFRLPSHQWMTGPRRLADVRHFLVSLVQLACTVVGVVVDGVTVLYAILQVVCQGVVDREHVSAVCVVNRFQKRSRACRTDAFGGVLE